MEISSPIAFTKMHGSGNDFVVIRLPDSQLEDLDIAEFTRQVCRRGMSIGADGVILISESDKADFHWRYINADGSDGDMCGNGAMVGARFAVEEGIVAESCSFETAAGIVHAEVDGGKVTLKMIDATWIAEDLSFEALPDVSFDHLTIGVPHVVGFVEDADDLGSILDAGRAIRQDPQLQPDGANVNFVHKIDDHSIRMRTYERGVEAETLACGTGAVCSAIASVRRGLVEQPVSVRVSSLMELTVSWVDEHPAYTSISLAGNTRIVATGEITPEALQGSY